MPSAPAPVRCGARRRTALHGMCLHIWRTVHRGSLELPSPTRHRVGSVHSFTHKSRIYRMERTHDSRLGRLPVRRGPTAPDRPNGQERSPTAERLGSGCTGAGAENRVLLLAKTVVTCGELELRRRRRSRIEPYTRTHYDPPSSESHRVSATTASPAKF